MFMPVDHTTDFLVHFREARDEWRSLLEFSRQQHSLIDEDSYPQLLQLLSRKQRILSCLDDLKRQHPEMREAWKQQRDLLPPALRDECEELLRETEAIVEALMEQEDTAASQLTYRHDATRRQLQALTAGSEVHAAYRDGLAPVTHRRLDLNQ